MSIDQLIADLRRAVLEGVSPNIQHLQELRQALKSRGDEAVPGLATLLRDPDRRIRRTAAGVLRAMASEPAYDELVADALRRLEDPTGRTKLPGPGWRSLLDLGRVVLPAMNRAYTLEQPFATRLSMIHMVQQMDDPAGKPLLEAALSESDSRLVEAAAEALGRVDGPFAYERLVQLLCAENVQHRIGAIRGLELLGNPAAVGPLLDVLSAEDQAYAQWGPSPAVGPATLHRAARHAINVLTGEQLDGDVARIRAWVEEHLGR